MKQRGTKELFIGLLLAAWLVSDGTTVLQGSQAVGTSQPGSTIEFFNPDGTRAGYGKAQGGTVEFFNPDSSRAGYGKVGPGGTVELFNPDSSRVGFGRTGR